MATSKFTLRTLGEDKYPQWDEFVQGSPQGTIFQRSTYIRIIQSVFHRDPQIIAVQDPDNIVGGIVLYPLQKFGIRYFTQPFYLPYNGFVLSDFASIKDYAKRMNLQQHVIELLQNYIEKQFDFGELYLPPDISDFRSLIWKGWKFSPEFDLEMDIRKPKNLSNLIRRNQMKHIQKFEKISPHFGEIQDPQILFNLIDQSYRYHKTSPPIPENQFVRLIKGTIDNKIGRIWGIQVEGRWIAAMLVIEGFPVFYSLFSGRDTEYADSEGKIYLYWKILNHYRNKNFEIFDMLGAMSPSISRVKIEMGGKLKRADKITYFKSGLYRLLFQLQSRRKLKERLL